MLNLEMVKTKNKKNMKSSYFIIITLQISKEEDGTWVATCNEMGTSTYGDSFEEVSEEIKELIILHLEALANAGEIERFFKENGIKKYFKKPPEVKIKTPLNPNVYIESYAQNLACV